MSFEIQCGRCGALSSPSVGTCPYCKSVFEPPAGQGQGSARELVTLYAEGKIEKALSLFMATRGQSPELDQDASFLLLGAKILFETEGPLGTIKALLMKAHLLAPEHSEIVDYLELTDAKEKLDLGSGDLAEQALKNLIRRTPKNPHALFLLGSHLYWSKKETEMSARYLQTCVANRPTFLRAWACLGAIYRATGHTDLSENAFRKCLQLETNPRMIAYFKSLIGQSAA
jgi:tetratricopeptide (TPR) repeat protein